MDLFDAVDPPPTQNPVRRAQGGVAAWLRARVTTRWRERRREAPLVHARGQLAARP
jgi:hypothetical protein